MGERSGAVWHRFCSSFISSRKPSMLYRRLIIASFFLLSAPILAGDEAHTADEPKNTVVFFRESLLPHFSSRSFPWAIHELDSALSKIDRLNSLPPTTGRDSAIQEEVWRIQK